MVLSSMVKLGIFDVLDKQGSGDMISTSQVASMLRTANPEAPSMINRMLCILASHSILTCSVEAYRGGGGCRRLYELVPLASFFTKNRWQSVQKGTEDDGVILCWEQLRFAGQFRDSMTGYKKLKEILRTYKGSEGVDTLVDVGGGDGSILGMIRSTYPSIKGINHDIVSVIEKSPEHAGVQYISGDMGMPSSSSGYFTVGETTSASKYLRILGHFIGMRKGNRCRSGNPRIPRSRWRRSERVSNVPYMKSMNSTEKEQTKEEFDVLGKQSGFSHIRIAVRAYNCSLIELYNN